MYEMLGANQSSKRMKKELHLIVSLISSNYSLINEVVSLAVLYELEI